MLNHLFLIVCCYLYLGDPWPRPKKHCAHFKISVLKYCRVLKQFTIKSHQGGPVICVQKDFPFFVLSWFRDLFGFDLEHLSI